MKKRGAKEENKAMQNIVPTPPQHKVSRQNYGNIVFPSAELRARLVGSKNEPGPSNTNSMLQNTRSVLTSQQNKAAHHKGSNRASPSAQEAPSPVHSEFVNPIAQEATSLLGYKSESTRSFSRIERYKDSKRVSPTATHEAPYFVKSRSKPGSSNTNNMLQKTRSVPTTPQHKVSHYKDRNRVNSRAETEAPSLLWTKSESQVLGRPDSSLLRLEGYEDGNHARATATNEAPSLVRSKGKLVGRLASESNLSFSRLQLKAHGRSLPHLNRLRIINYKRRDSHTVSSGAAFYSEVIARQVVQAAEQAAKRVEMERIRNKTPKRSTSESPDSAASTIFGGLLRLLILGWQMCARMVTASYGFLFT